MTSRDGIGITNCMFGLLGLPSRQPSVVLTNTTIRLCGCIVQARSRKIRLTYDFNIIGGNGVYAIDGIVNHKDFRYLQPHAGSELVAYGQATRALRQKHTISAAILPLCFEQPNTFVIMASQILRSLGSGMTRHSSKAHSLLYDTSVASFTAAKRVILRLKVISNRNPYERFYPPTRTRV